MLNLSENNRSKIAKSTESPSQPYTEVVSQVNKILGKLNVPVSDKMTDKIINSVKKVENGDLHSSTASLKESAGFALDAVNAIQDRKLTYAAWSTIGTVVNMVGGTFVFPAAEFGKMSPEKKIRTMQENDY